MNKQEIIKTILYIKSLYPIAYKNQTKEEYEMLIFAWERQFKEFEFDVVINAIDSVIASERSDFAPNIAKIKHKIFDMCNPGVMSEQEAWTTVFKILPKCDKGTRDIFNQLPPLIQKCVGSPTTLREWAYMDTTTLNSVVASNFMRSYREIAQRDKERALTTQETKDKFKITSESSMRVFKLPEHHQNFIEDKPLTKEQQLQLEEDLKKLQF